MFKIEAAMETWLGEEKETQTQTKMQKSWGPTAWILADYGFIRQVMSNLMMINVLNHRPQLIQIVYQLEPERNTGREKWETNCYEK